MDHFKTIVVMGTTGHGKSALVSKLQMQIDKARNGSPGVAPDDGNMQGTTKEIENGWQCRVGARKCMMYDTPGIGDYTIKNQTRSVTSKL